MALRCGAWLQEQKRAAVLRALLPIALGHALSIGIIIAAVLLARISLPHSALKIAAAAMLFAFGLYRLFRSRHPNWVGMRVGFGELTLWSFIMASAHGAGLMLIPLFLKPAEAPLTQDADRMGSHMEHAQAGWTCGCVSAVDSRGQTIWIADTHSADGNRFIVRADEN
jgi:hypothetical protein